MQNTPDTPDISTLVKKQKAFFATGITRDISFRKAQLKKLLRAVMGAEEDIATAFREDMHKSAFEAYMTETGLLLQEIRFHLKHLKRWARPRRVPSPVVHFPAASRILAEPYGSVLVLSPWNYPFLLLFSPLTGALSAGNCAILKPSGRVPALNRVFRKIIEDTFPPEYVTLVSGGHDVSGRLLEEPFDYIFFTGSKQVGKKVMTAAARHLTPVSLELGGKNPCIVHHDADLKTAARRIIWGKFVNAGQTCVAPDYLLVHNSVRKIFTNHLLDVLETFYGKDASHTDDLTRITGRENVFRLQEFIAEGRVLYGGKSDPENLYVAPTLLDGITPRHKVMADEIFGPVLPLLTYETTDDLLAVTADHPNPLALYVFSGSRAFTDMILKKIPSGTAAINETVTQFANEHLPFSGKGESGMGAYHGKFSFDTFSHYRGVLKKGTWLDIPFRYPPYSAAKLNWIKKFLK
jgi:aldehyde dehydrogenase (NAD+)